jgi:putative endonuclease
MQETSATSLQLPIRPCFVYLIADLSSASLRSYVGWTTDLERRLAAHNASKGAKATRGRHWTLIHSERYKTRSEAMQAEYALKKDRIRRQSLLTHYLSQSSNANP